MKLAVCAYCWVGLLPLRAAMPDRRGRSYREWSSDESESDESDSDHASGHIVPPPRARTLAVEPSPFTVTVNLEAMPFAIDVSAPALLDSSPRNVVFVSYFPAFKRSLYTRAFERCVSIVPSIMPPPWPSALTKLLNSARFADFSTPHVCHHVTSNHASFRAILRLIKMNQTCSFMISFQSNYTTIFLSTR